MEKKKLIITATIVSVCLVAAAIPTSIAIVRAYNLGTPRTFSNDITPNKPGRGETVSFLPESISQYWQMDDLLNTYPDKVEQIADLYTYNTELASWTNYLDASNVPVNKPAIRAIFEKYDLFHPTNNILSWDSKIEAKEYKVIISQDKTFSTIEREYTVSGTEDSVVFENPYTGVDYYWQVIATKNDDSEVYSDIFNFTVASLPRTVFIEGVSNTRDLGGNVGLGGKRMKQGLVYRGMGIETATDAGSEEFKNQLGIKTELDLRNVGEGLENYLEIPNYQHFPGPIEYTGDAANASNIANGPNVANFGNAVKVLANKNNYPVYFHCAVGRDRTGWMGLCLNLLCGVGEEASLKDFCLSLFSSSAAMSKGNVAALYSRYIRIRDYINTFDGNNLSEKMESYLVTKAGVTSEECENVRKILLGDISTGFVPGTVSPTSYTDLAKVTFRQYGESPIIKMVEIGSKLEEPNISGHGAWYHGNDLWDFENDVVTSDMYLDYISNDKCKVVVHYSGINVPDDTFEVDYHTNFDFSIFEKDGYTYKVFDDSYTRIYECVVDSDVSINVVYTPTSGYVPKANSRIIVMAGQSNGAGVAHYPYLEESLTEDKLQEINNGYDNVKIMGYSHEFFSWKKVSADKHSVTSGTPGTFGFEVGMADRLSKAYPDETTYIVKCALGATSLNWEWISPSAISTTPVEVTSHMEGEGIYRGYLYDYLHDCLTNAIDSISEATNTIPMVEAFMWMQGESDSAFDGATDLYLETFNTFMDDFTSDFEDNISYKFRLYDAGISETGDWPHAVEINNAKKARVDDKNIYIDTNARLTTLFEPYGMVTDIAHYDAACYIDLGHMFADAYLSRTKKGYKANALEIEMPASINISRGQTCNLPVPTVLFNGIPVNNAKISYFAQQYTSDNDIVYSYFTVNHDGTITAGSRTGNTQLRISAYYNDEVRTILVPVTITF